VQPGATSGICHLAKTCISRIRNLQPSIVVNTPQFRLTLADGEGPIVSRICHLAMFVGATGQAAPQRLGICRPTLGSSRAEEFLPPPTSNNCQNTALVVDCNCSCGKPRHVGAPPCGAFPGFCPPPFGSKRPEASSSDLFLHRAIHTQFTSQLWPPTVLLYCCV